MLEIPQNHRLYHTHRLIVTQYFLMKGIDDISYISGANKLKPYIGKIKTTYKDRKQLSINWTKRILTINPIVNTWYEPFICHKKKDDLADCFLQALWYINDKYKYILKY